MSPTCHSGRVASVLLVVLEPSFGLVLSLMGSELFFFFLDLVAFR